MDALTAQLASLPVETLQAMARGALYPSARLIIALRVAERRAAAQKNERDFPALRWVTL